MKKNFNIVPEELIMQQLLNLDINDIKEKSLVSKKYKKLYKDDKFWCHLIKRDFGFNPKKMSCKEIYYKMTGIVDVSKNVTFFYKPKNIYVGSNIIKLSNNLDMFDNFIKQYDNKEQFLYDFFRNIYLYGGKSEYGGSLFTFYYNIMNIDLKNAKNIFQKYNSIDIYDSNILNIMLLFLYDYEYDENAYGEQDESNVYDEYSKELINKFYKNDKNLLNKHIDRISCNNLLKEDVDSVGDINDLYNPDREELIIKDMKEYYKKL